MLLLLCQGLIFEIADSDSGAVRFFGIFLFILMCLFVLISFSFVLLSICRRNHGSKIYLHRMASQKLSFETLNEVYFVYSMSFLERNEVIAIDAAWLQLAGTTENEEFRSLLIKLEDSDQMTYFLNIGRQSNLGSPRSYEENLARFKEYVVSTYGINRGQTTF
jgi:hypothetical protein